ncbi:MAG: VWA domain-containing protein [Oscillospiraceae bacterium]|nr:VWA domain-containing protein [Oscillospiraceae bacterium]
MTKRTRRLLSLLLCLVMFVTLAIPGFAAGGTIGGVGDGMDREIGEGDIRDFDGLVPEEAEEEFFTLEAKDEESGLKVTVDAPNGSLPTLAELRIERVDVEDVREVIEETMGEQDILMAVDISFWLNGIEIEPEEPVRVIIQAPELEGIANMTLIHIPEEDDPETVALISQDDLSFALGTNEIAFVSDSFSTYVVTWTGNSTATIHWGTLNNGAFTEFEGTASLDTTAVSVNLNVRFEDYEYTGAYYEVTDENDVTTRFELDSSVLTKVVDGDDYSWTMQVRVTTGTGEDETTTVETRTIENGMDIYAFYSEKGAGHTPPGPAPADVQGPETEKQVSDNGNGTYQICLDITGHVSHTETRVGANVIIVFDNTKSMRYYMDGTDGAPTGQRRIDYVRPALKTLINTLDPDVHTINLAFALFNSGASTHSWGSNSITGLTHWTQDKATMLAYTDSNDLSPVSGSGTNWEIGLDEGLDLLGEAQNANNAILNANKTYIIFVTDGDPNRWVGYPANWNNQYNHNDEAVQNAQDEANDMVTAGAKLYGIFCGSSSGLTRLQTLINTAGGVQTIEATNATAIDDAFKGIAQTIVNDLNATNTTVDDGIPELADVSASVSGTASGYKYYISYPLTLVTEGDHAGEYSYSYKDDQDQVVTAYVAANTVTSGAVDREAEGYAVAPGYVYTTDEDNVRHYYKTEEWTKAPAAGYSSTNGVTWDLSDAGALLDETIYTITFDVWPSQEAYDLLANLNNNMPDYQLGKLKNAVREQLVVTVDGHDFTYTSGETEGAGTWSDGTTTYATTAAFQAAIDQALAQNKVVNYNILTNTHLYTTYTLGNDTFTDPPENGLVSGAMLLEDQTIDIIKYWHNDLDAQQAEQITLTVTKDGEKYLGVVMGEPTQVPGEEHEWVQVPATADSTIYISCGIMTVDSAGKLTMNTTGHDYSVVETDGSPWFWDLTAYTYHPMVINAENKMLILVTDELKAGEIYNDNFPSDITDTNPADLTRVVSTVDGRTYYRFNGKLYVQTDAPTNTLRADNDRRSNLQIAKAVTEGSPEDELFTFQVTMENTTTPYKGDDNYDPDYHTFWFVVLNDPDNLCDLAQNDPNFLDPENPDPTKIVWEADGLEVTGATLEQKTNDQGEPIEGEYTGYYWFDNVDGGTPVTIKIKPGWRICFTSITKDTDYTVVEPNASMPDGFMLYNVETSAHCNKSGDVATAGVVSTTDPALVEGSIDASNSDYRVYYTNRFVGFFYVYHSSDCTLERFPAATEGALYGGEKTFSITDLTRDGTLYGGYYSDYAGKSTGFDAAAAKALDYSGENDPADVDGTTYTTDYIKESNRGAWSASAALSVNGFAMAPVANTVYYLKEVPTAYLQPYFHYTYSKENFDIFDAWLISDIDDALYRETGFVIVSEDEEANVCTTLTVKTTNVGGSTVLLKPETIFRSKGVKSGYLTYLQVLVDGSPTLMKENDRVVQYWVTPDGLIVTGIAARTYSGLGNKADLEKTDIPVDTTIKVFENFELPVEP